MAQVIPPSTGSPPELLSKAASHLARVFDIRQESPASPEAAAAIGSAASEALEALEAPEWGFFLDRKQERMACELASPRTLVYGPAGSAQRSRSE